MNVTPVQNNNSQSFGMAFKLKGDGARKLATLLEETNAATNKRVMEDLIAPIHSLKTEVVYDGKNVSVGGRVVSERCPAPMPGSDYKDLQYVLEDGKVYHVIYDSPKNNLLDVYEGNPLMQKLFNAREIAKDMDVKAADAAYKSQQAAAKEARILKMVQNLENLYG